jgi:hypothetical protein
MSYNKYLQKSHRHWQRRAIHLSMLIIPIIYYWYGDVITRFLGVSINTILLILSIATSLFELLRIHKGWLFFGQREYERHYPSAFSWSVIGIILVLYFSPLHGQQGAAFGLPIIWSMCIGDPLLGELRRAKYNALKSILLTLIPLTLVWLLASVYLGTPLLLSCIMPSLIIASEWPSVRYLDDNFLMLAIPLLFIRLIY